MDIKDRFGLTPIRIKKDGNCLFRVLSQALHGKQDLHLEIRKECTDLIESNHSPLLDEERRREILENIREPGSWGGAIELEVVIAHYKANAILIDFDVGKGNRDISLIAFNLLLNDDILKFE